MTKPLTSLAFAVSLLLAACGGAAAPASPAGSTPAAAPSSVAATYVKELAHIPMLATTGSAGQALLLDPRFTSDYLMRFSTVAAAHADTSADWAYKQGLRKMAIITYDTAAGVESGDLVASA